MPYFTVDFGLDNGYAHIIEDDESFPEHFAKVNIEINFPVKQFSSHK